MGNRRSVRVSLDEMTELFLGTLWVAGGIIALAAFLVAVLIGVRKLLQRNDSD